MTPANGPNTDPDSEGIDALLGACLEQGEARLEELVENSCEAHPDRAAAIREEVETARSAGLRRRTPDGSDAGVPERGAPFERIGPYQPLREIGRGGQGFVYLAEDTRLHRVVALKVLKGFGALSDKVIQRFRREAEVASRLDHPCICSVYDAGVAAGIPYIAMRFVDGRTLADSIKLGRTSLPTDLTGGDLIEFEDDGAPEPAPSTEPSSVTTTRKRSEILEIVAIVEKVARALHAAHEAGIIHRDIKPGNIMVTPAGEPVILDFGLASDEANELSLTQTGDLFGTPAYMSPEQLMAQRIRLDRRTDVYSLAATLYECVTLQRPFDAATREAMYEAIQYKEPSHARRLNPEVPGDLETVLEKALEKHRDRRYATALDFAEDLRRVRELEPIAARRVSAAGRLVRWARRRPARAALVAILVIGIPTIAGLAGYAVAKAPEIRRGEELALLAEVDRHIDKGYAELVHAGDKKIAIAAFESALALNPDSGEAIAGEALALHEAGDYTAVLRFLDEHPVVEGRDFAVTRIRYDALCALGREAEALEFAKRSPRDARTPLAFLVSGLIEMYECCERPTDKERFRKALGLFTHAVLASHHARPKFHFALCHAAQHLEEVGPSRQIHDALLDLWPDSGVAAWNAGCAVRAFDPVAAAAAYEKALELEPDDPKSLACLVTALISKGEPDEAVAACRRAIPFQPVSAHYQLGNALDALHKPDEAIAAYRKSIELQPDSAEAYFHLGLALTKKGSIDESIAAYRRSIELAPKQGQSWTNLGLALGRKGDIDEAIEHHRKAIELNPRLELAHVNLGHTLLARGRIDDAISSLRKAIELIPGSNLLHYNLAVALRDKGNVDQAIAAFRKAIELDPKDADAYNNLGSLLCNAKREYDAAIAAFEKAIALRPDLPSPYQNLYHTVLQKGDDDFATAYSRKMLVGRPDDPKVYWFYFTLGIPLTKKGDLDGAIGIWRKMIQLRPDDPMPRSNLGAALARKGDREAGLAELRKAIEIDPKFTDAHRALATALRDMGDHDAAIPVWRKLIELLPDDPTAYLELANSYAAQGRLLLTLEVRRRGHELGSARPDWPYPTADWVAEDEGAVLAEASQLALAGLEADSSADRGKAAERIEALLVGWRKDVDGRRRLEAVGASLSSLREDPWVVLRNPAITAKLAEAERKRWSDLFSALDDLARRIEGGETHR